MKVLRFFGWLFFPYILIFFRWRQLKTLPRVLFILWSLIVLSEIINSSHQQESQPASAAVTTQEQPTNKPIQDQNNNKPVATTSKPVPKQPSPDQTKAQKIAQLQAEYKNATTYQEKMNLMRELITIDKPYFLTTNPTVQDLGFAGDLFITTNKHSVQPLSSVGDQLISQQANGIYLEVEVDLSNIGANPIQANTDMFTLVTSDGRKFSTDTKAEMIISKSILIDTLNPGVDTLGYLIFDVPTDIKISDVMLNVQNGFNNVKLKLS